MNSDVLNIAFHFGCAMFLIPCECDIPGELCTIRMYNSLKVDRLGAYRSLLEGELRNLKMAPTSVAPISESVLPIYGNNSGITGTTQEYESDMEVFTRVLSRICEDLERTDQLKRAQDLRTLFSKLISCDISPIVLSTFLKRIFSYCVTDVDSIDIIESPALISVVEYIDSKGVVSSVENPSTFDSSNVDQGMRSSTDSEPLSTYFCASPPKSTFSNVVDLKSDPEIQNFFPLGNENLSVLSLGVCDSVDSLQWADLKSDLDSKEIGMFFGSDALKILQLKETKTEKPSQPPSVFKEVLEKELHKRPADVSLPISKISPFLYRFEKILTPKDRFESVQGDGSYLDNRFRGLNKPILNHVSGSDTDGRSGKVLLEIPLYLKKYRLELRLSALVMQLASGVSNSLYTFAGNSLESGVFCYIKSPRVGLNLVYSELISVESELAPFLPTYIRVLETAARLGEMRNCLFSISSSSSTTNAIKKQEKLEELNLQDLEENISNSISVALRSRLDSLTEDCLLLSQWFLSKLEHNLNKPILSEVVGDSNEKSISLQFESALVGLNVTELNVGPIYVAFTVVSNLLVEVETLLQCISTPISSSPEDNSNRCEVARRICREAIDKLISAALTCSSSTTVSDHLLSSSYGKSGDLKSLEISNTNNWNQKLTVGMVSLVEHTLEEMIFRLKPLLYPEETSPCLGNTDETSKKDNIFRVNKLKELFSQYLPKYFDNGDLLDRFSPLHQLSTHREGHLGSAVAYAVHAAEHLRSHSPCLLSVISSSNLLSPIHMTKVQHSAPSAQSVDSGLDHDVDRLKVIDSGLDLLHSISRYAEIRVLLLLRSSPLFSSTFLSKNQKEKDAVVADSANEMDDTVHLEGEIAEKNLADIPIPADLHTALLLSSVACGTAFQILLDSYADLDLNQLRRKILSSRRNLQCLPMLRLMGEERYLHQNSSTYQSIICSPLLPSAPIGGLSSLMRYARWFSVFAVVKSSSSFSSKIVPLTARNETSDEGEVAGIDGDSSSPFISELLSVADRRRLARLARAREIQSTNRLEQEALAAQSLAKRQLLKEKEAEIAEKLKQKRLDREYYFSDSVTTTKNTSEIVPISDKFKPDLEGGKMGSASLSPPIASTVEPYLMNPDYAEARFILLRDFGERLKNLELKHVSTGDSTDTSAESIFMVIEALCSLGPSGELQARNLAIKTGFGELFGGVDSFPSGTDVDDKYDLLAILPEIRPLLPPLVIDILSSTLSTENSNKLNESLIWKDAFDRSLEAAGAAGLLQPDVHRRAAARAVLDARKGYNGNNDSVEVENDVELSLDSNPYSDPNANPFIHSDLDVAGPGAFYYRHRRKFNILSGDRFDDINPTFPTRDGPEIIDSKGIIVSTDSSGAVVEKKRRKDEISSLLRAYDAKEEAVPHYANFKQFEISSKLESVSPLNGSEEPPISILNAWTNAASRDSGLENIMGSVPEVTYLHNRVRTFLAGFSPQFDCLFQSENGNSDQDDESRLSTSLKPVRNENAGENMIVGSSRSNIDGEIYLRHLRKRLAAPLHTRALALDTAMIVSTLLTSDIFAYMEAFRGWLCLSDPIVRNLISDVMFSSSYSITPLSTAPNAVSNVGTSSSRINPLKGEVMKVLSKPLAAVLHALTPAVMSLSRSSTSNSSTESASSKSSSDWIEMSGTFLSLIEPALVEIPHSIQKSIHTSVCGPYAFSTSNPLDSGVIKDNYANKFTFESVGANIREGDPESTYSLYLSNLVKRTKMAQLSASVTTSSVSTDNSNSLFETVDVELVAPQVARMSSQCSPSIALARCIRFHSQILDTCTLKNVMALVLHAELAVDAENDLDFTNLNSEGRPSINGKFISNLLNRELSLAQVIFSRRMHSFSEYKESIWRYLTEIDGRIASILSSLLSSISEHLEYFLSLESEDVSTNKLVDRSNKEYELACYTVDKIYSSIGFYRLFLEPKMDPIYAVHPFISDGALEKSLQREDHPARVLFSYYSSRGNSPVSSKHSDEEQRSLYRNSNGIFFLILSLLRSRTELQNSWSTLSELSRFRRNQTQYFHSFDDDPESIMSIRQKLRYKAGIWDEKRHRDEYKSRYLSRITSRNLTSNSETIDSMSFLELIGPIHALSALRFRMAHVVESILSHILEVCIPSSLRMSQTFMLNSPSIDSIISSHRLFIGSLAARFMLKPDLSSSSSNIFIDNILACVFDLSRIVSESHLWNLQFLEGDGLMRLQERIEELQTLFDTRLQKFIDALKKFNTPMYLLGVRFDLDVESLLVRLGVIVPSSSIF